MNNQKEESDVIVEYLKGTLKEKNLVANQFTGHPQKTTSGKANPFKEREHQIMRLIASTKSSVCAEFEKVCQTEKSLKRMVKEMHNIFDELECNIRSTYHETALRGDEK